MKIFAVIITAVVASTLLLTGCSTTGSDSPGTSTANSDPKLGWVFIDTGEGAGSSGTWVAKKCDGSTLVYVSDGFQSGGVSTIVNSSECAG